MALNAVCCVHGVPLDAVRADRERCDKGMADPQLRATCGYRRRAARRTLLCCGLCVLSFVAWRVRVLCVCVFSHV